MKAVIALGGNALLRRGERADADVQMANVRIAAKAAAEIAKEHNVVLTHGNGPQVGIIYIATLDYHLCSLSDSFRFAFPYDNDPAFYAL